MSSRHGRERQIAEILARRGMTYLVGVLGLERLVSWERGVRHRDPQKQFPAPPEDLRLALEELGPTFIKIGQLLSTRADLLPPAYQEELAKLQDSGPRVPADAVRDTLESELHASPEQAFASFDEEPLAAASIGQAHAATLHDGTEVVVKVRRPGVVEVVQQDLEILQNLAARASRRWETAARYDLVDLAYEFGGSLRAQLDYLREARNAERFATNFAQDRDVQIPRVFAELTTSRVITLERLYGMKITDLGALDAAGVERHALANRAAGVTAKMMFADGFFHGDPHPGNFFIQPSGRIGMIDFGLTGTLDDRLRERLRRLLVAFVREDPERLADALVGLGISTGQVDRSGLSQDLEKLLHRYFGRSVGEIALGPAIRELLSIARRHSLRLPPDLALVLGVVVIDEGIAAQLDPRFRFAEALAPYARRHILSQGSPDALRRRAAEVAMDFEELAVDLPGQLHRVLEVLASGGVELHVRTSELEPLLARAERVGNRIAVSVLAAALIDGLAGLAAANRGRGRNGRLAIGRSTLRGLVSGSASAYTGRRLVSAARRPFSGPKSLRL
jgi:ubiquinone biosynthesis protein